MPKLDSSSKNHINGSDDPSNDDDSSYSSKNSDDDYDEDEEEKQPLNVDSATAIDKNCQQFDEDDELAAREEL